MKREGFRLLIVFMEVTLVNPLSISSSHNNEHKCSAEAEASIPCKSASKNAFLEAPHFEVRALDNHVLTFFNPECINTALFTTFQQLMST